MCCALPHPGPLPKEREVPYPAEMFFESDRRHGVQDRRVHETRRCQFPSPRGRGIKGEGKLMKHFNIADSV